ncbi:MAG: IS66 family insertion sequence element accessory protein TnpB [Chromatiaceae bacterium]|jgi:transposase
MIRLTHSTPVMVAIAPIDFRRQIDGLAAHCRQALSSDPMSGTWFVFINRGRTMIRVLVYDGTGFWLMTKRLSRGRFQGWPTADGSLSSMAARTLMQVLQAQGEPEAVAVETPARAS